VSGEAYDAGSGVQASAPPSVSVDTLNSNCPPFGGNCKIVLQWAAVTTDTAGAAIGVDKYRITRYRKTINDIDYTLDTTFGTSGNLDQAGWSQSNSGIIAYTDNPPATDVNDQPYYYKYTMAANDCRLGLISVPVYYPSLCTVNPVIVQAGQQGSASGDSPSQPWVFNAGDTITVTPPVTGGITISKVQFDLYAWPSGTFVETKTVNSAPFVYSWTDRTDNQIYFVRITVTSSTGCTEVHVKYVQDQQAAACAFTALATGPSASESTQGSTTTAVSTMTITNPAAADIMKLNGSSYSLTFQDPDGNHSDIKLISTTWATSVNTWTDTLGTPVGPSTVTRSFPTVTPVMNVAPTTTLTITVRWQYSKKDNGRGGINPISGPPLTKLCIGYTIASEPGVTKHCNLVGQAAQTANPTSCD
jgi:hypothetical protein